MASSRGKEDDVRVDCSRCEIAMGKLHDAVDGDGNPVAVYLCPGCGGRVGVVDDSPRRRSGRQAPAEGVVHGRDVAFPAEDGGES